MRSVLAGLRQLVLPWGSPATAPHIVLGPDVPATLRAATTDFTWTAAIVEYFDGTSYAFEAIGYYNLPTPGFDRVVARGTYDPVHGVLFSEEQHQGALQIFYGSDVYNSAMQEWNYQKGTLKISSTAVINVDGKQYARGLVGWDASQAGIAAFSADTQMNKLTGMVFKAGHAYEFRWANTVSSSAANELQLHLYLAAIGGSSRGEAYLQQLNTGWHTREGSWHVKNGTASDVTTDIVLGMLAVTGTVTCQNNVNRVRSLGMWDIGAAVDYPNATDI